MKPRILAAFFLSAAAAASARAQTAPAAEVTVAEGRAPLRRQRATPS